jgi:hypothetical protein
MNKAKISFRVIGDSGPVTISWFDGPKGNAVEAKNGIGVGFFSPSGDLLCVEFDDVDEKKDHQVLEFDHYRVDVEVNNGKVAYAVEELKVRSRRRRVA